METKWTCAVALACSIMGNVFGQESKLKIEMVQVTENIFNSGENWGHAFKYEPFETQVELFDFAISKYEVTQELYEAVMKKNPSKHKCALCPVENVTYYEALEFITELNKLTEHNYRLPTMSEWEYAAKGANFSKHYPFPGGYCLDSVAWNASNSNGVTHEVGQLFPNELGLYDMAGNVGEYTMDRDSRFRMEFHENYSVYYFPYGMYQIVKGNSYSDRNPDMDKLYIRDETIFTKNSNFNYVEVEYLKNNKRLPDVGFRLAESLFLGAEQKSYCENPSDEGNFVARANCFAKANGYARVSSKRWQLRCEGLRR
jgi:formylglycine-generating enzyme required for sulfatase activity